MRGAVAVDDVDDVDDVVELLDGDWVRDVEDDVGEDVGLDDSLVPERVLLDGWESRVRVPVDVPVGRTLTSGALLRPPNAGGGKSSTSVPFNASLMKAVHTRTGMLPPVTSESPPRPLSDSCTARPSLTPPR
jgi:hypothetical protein